MCNDSQDFRLEQGEELKTNKAKISGVIQDEFKEFDTGLYMTKVSVKRKSGVIDNIPIVVPESFMPRISCAFGLVKNKFIEIEGTIRSKNIEGNDGKRHLKVFVYPESMHITDDANDLYEPLYTNYVYLEGQMCVNHWLRETPRGTKICDFLVKKRHFDTYCIPCITWNKLAIQANGLSVNDKIVLEGRFQSRFYVKKQQVKEVYEVSIYRLN